MPMLSLQSITVESIEDVIFSCDLHFDDFVQPEYLMVLFKIKTYL